MFQQSNKLCSKTNHFFANYTICFDMCLFFAGMFTTLFQRECRKYCCWFSCCVCMDEQDSESYAARPFRHQISYHRDRCNGITPEVSYYGSTRCTWTVSTDVTSYLLAGIITIYKILTLTRALTTAFASKCKAATTTCTTVMLILKNPVTCHANL